MEMVEYQSAWGVKVTSQHSNTVVSWVGILTVILRG